jgi:predicted  nucleic acid-binding Zn-ribbon protein
MQRELSPDLFKEEANPRTATSPAANSNAKALSDNYEALSRRMESFETRFEQISKNLTLRMERTTTMISHVQTQINHVSNDVNEKIVQLSAKVNERRLAESRIEDLIERHNTEMKALEARMQQLQRMVTELRNSTRR